MTDPCATPGLLTVDEARARLLAAAPAPLPGEIVPLNSARGMVLASSPRALVDVPPDDNAAMDGYAFRLDDLRAASGVLPVSQRIPAGTVPPPLAPASAARIFTGAALPEGADLVLMQEDAEERNGSLFVREELVATLKPGAHIRRRGEDIQAGRPVLPAGMRLGPAQLGVLAAAGHAEVPVYPRLRVAFFSTGDELMEPGEDPQPGRIYNSNRYALRAYLDQAGCCPIDLGVVPDDRDATVTALRAAASRADLVITTGGASVGEEDHLKAALAACGQVDLWKVAIKPGKPLLFGHIDAARGEVPVLGLPGNPVSVAVTFLVLALPLLRAMQGQVPVTVAACPVPAGFAVDKPGNREEYLRVRLVAHRQGMRLEKHAQQGSGVLASVAWAQGLARIPAGRTVAEGDGVDFLSFADLLG